MDNLNTVNNVNTDSTPANGSAAKAGAGNGAGGASWWETHRPSKRRLIQVYSALLYNAHVKGFIEGEIYTGNTKAVCVPGFNCYSCPAAVGACPLGSLQNALASSGNRAGFYVYGILLLFGLTLGRTICGWICPLGLIQELLHKIPTHKIKKSRITRALSYLKYIVLVVFAVAIPLWYGVKYGMAVPGFCKYICPAGTLEGAMGLLSNPANDGYFSMLGILFTRKFVIMLVIALACTFCYRSFCRFLCPLGAIYGMFNKIAVVGVKVDTGRCTNCGSCVRSCGMDVRHIGDHECINCAKCMDVCKSDAISVKAGNITLKAPAAGCSDDKPDSAKKRRTAGKAACVILLAVMLAAGIWYNLLDASGDTGTDTEDWRETAYGYSVGDELSPFAIECVDGTTFDLAETRGKVTFINLWATYCGPCVQELPFFAELYKEHGDDIALVAVHNSLTDQDVPAYLEGKGWDIPFAVDTKDKVVWNAVGGGSTLPQTIVLDREGRVVYNKVGSVTPDLLDKLYRDAAGTK